MPSFSVLPGVKVFVFETLNRWTVNFISRGLDLTIQRFNNPHPALVS
jgi:hypothetical protein